MRGLRTKTGRMMQRSRPRLYPLLLLVLGLLWSGGVPGQQAGFQRREKPVGPGAKRVSLRDASTPLSVEAVELDTANRYLLLRSALGREPCVGRGTVTEISSRVFAPAARTLAAANSDYFSMTAGNVADPLGLQVEDGEIVSAPFAATGGGKLIGRSALVILKGGIPVICAPTMRAWAERAGQRENIVAVNEPARRDGLSLFTWRYPWTGGPLGVPASSQAAQSLTAAVLGSINVPLRSHTSYQLAVRGVGAFPVWQMPIGATPAENCGTGLGRDELLLVGGGRAASFVEALQPGDAVKVRVELSPFGPDIEAAVGGGPRIVREGRVSVDAEQEGFSAFFAQTRHPRTAVGLRGRTLCVVAVDGRQPGYSMGMTLLELAELMLSLGCTEAINLDGGGSTTLWVRGGVVNSPSDGFERRVANALIALNSSPIGPAVRLTLTPDSINALPGARVAITAEVEDANYNLLPVSAIAWTCDGRMGRVDEKGVFEAAPVEKPQTGFITATSGAVSSRVAIAVLPSPAKLEIQPARVLISPGQTAKLILRALDDRGRQLLFPTEGVRWETTVGSFEAPGLLRASQEMAAGTVRAVFGSTAAEAQVFVGTVRRLVEDFEDISEWRFASWPPEAPGSLTQGPGPGGKGMAACLSYDFSTLEVPRAVYAKLGATIGRALRISLRVLGDGNAHWLRARVIDGQNRVFTLDLAAEVGWREWRQVAAMIPPEAQSPITLDSIYLVETKADKKTKGTICLDDLEVEEAEGPFMK